MTVDRRVQRTRKLLGDALMALILEKGYDAITVQDITDRANLGRATFYLHYRDKEDLLFSVMTEVIDELKAAIELPESAWRGHVGEAPLLLAAFKHAEENVDLYRVLLSGQATTTFLIRLREYIAQTVQKAIEVVYPNYEGRVPIDVAANYMSGALFMLVEWWLRDNMPYPPEEMARWLWDLVIIGMARTMELGQIDEAGLLGIRSR
jgi:AcrR family transcriptional regulator